MKLKTKRLLAAALALSLTANISLAAFAVTYSYDIDVDSVYVDGNTSWQGDENTAAEEKDTLTEDDDVYIYSSSKEATENTVTISGDVDNSVIIDDITFEVNDEDSAAIIIEDNSDVDDLTIQDTEIIVNAEGSVGIEIGDDAEANITLKDSEEDSDDIAVDIELNAGTTSGIEIGEGSDVTITVDGTTDITANYADDENEEGIENEVGSGNMTVGIAVGGGAYDGSGSSSTDDDDDAVKSKVVITGTTDDDDTLNISDTSVGILVHEGTELVIGDDDEEDEDKETIKVNINGAERTYDADNDNKDFYTVSGKGIMSYDDLTITDGATVNIDDSDVIGINVIGGDLEISGGAQVSVTDTGKSNDLKADTGDSKTYAGIYVETGSNTLITGEGTKVTVGGTSETDDEGNVTWTTSAGKGIGSEGGEDTYFEVSDGATVTVDHTEEDGISIGGNQEMIITNNGIVNISNAATGLYLNPGSTLYVTDYNGNDEETDSSKLVISDITGNGISADNANIDIGGQYALVTITDVGNAGIALSGTTASKYLKVYDSSNLNITRASYVGIVVGDDGYGGNNYYKTVEILSDAIVTITESGSNSVILYGGENTLTVDDATLTANGRISLYGGKSITVDAETYKEMFNITDDELTENVELSVKTAYPSGQSTITVTVKNPDTGENTVYYYIVDFVNSKLYEAEAEKDNNNNIIAINKVADGDEFNFDSNLTKDHTSEVIINNGSKVTASAVRDYSYHSSLTDIYGAVGKLIVNGGTLEFTEDGTSKNDCDLSYDDAETLKNEANNSPDTWAVSGDENGGEELTNFKVSISYLKELQEDLIDKYGEMDNLTFFNTFGFVITSDDTMTDVNGDAVEANQLIIKTYGYSKDEDSGEGSYIDYNSNKEREEGYTTTKWYVVDLNKYCDEQGNIVDDELWIWTPAIVLSYYALNEDQELGDAEDYSESDPEDPVTDEIAVKLTVNHDVIYRGGSLIFDSFKTNESLETISDTSVLHNTDTAYQEALDKLDTDEYAGYSGLKIYDAYYIDTGWEDFDDETIVLLAEGTNFGYKNLFAPVKTEDTTPGGGGDSDPDPDPEPDPTPTPEPTPDPTPDEPREPEEPLEPETPVVPVVPVTPETPAQPGETPAETPADPEAPAEPATPASSTPKTGDEANVAIYLVMAALSGAALIGLGVTGRKKNEEV